MFSAWPAGFEGFVKQRITIFSLTLLLSPWFRLKCTHSLGWTIIFLKGGHGEKDFQSQSLLDIYMTSTKKLKTKFPPKRVVKNMLLHKIMKVLQQLGRQLVQEKLPFILISFCSKYNNFKLKHIWYKIYFYFSMYIVYTHSLVQEFFLVPA